MTQARIAKREAIIGYTAAVCSAASYGTLAVVARKVVSDISPPIVANAFSMILATLILAVIFQSHIRSDYKLRPSWKGWLFVALAGGAGAWGISFMFLALSKAPAILVSPLTGTAPLFSVLLTLIFLRGMERVTLRTVLGALLVVGGVILITFGIE